MLRDPKYCKMGRLEKYQQGADHVACRYRGTLMSHTLLATESSVAIHRMQYYFPVTRSSPGGTWDHMQ